jgi:hypothetical protein
MEWILRKRSRGQQGELIVAIYKVLNCTGDQDCVE